MIELPEWLQSKIQPEPNSGCWLWTAATNGDGYGYVKLPENGFYARAHRVVYAFYKGNIPEGRVIDHLCRVRCCVNPEHMRVATDRENVLAGVGPTAQNALKTICCNGHSLVNAYVFRRKRDGRLGRQCRECQAERSRAYEASGRRRR